MMNRNYNLSELSDYTYNNISEEETTNNSFGDKETKELLFVYNNALCKVKDNIEHFKKNQNIMNEGIKQEKIGFKSEIKNFKNQIENLEIYKQSYDRKMDLISKDITIEKEYRNNNGVTFIHNPELSDEYVKIFFFILLKFFILDGLFFQSYFFTQNSFISNFKRLR